jgi:N utilization substance protein B
MSARVNIIQKLYSKKIDKEAKIVFEKNRYKTLIKNVVNGVLERQELIDEKINSFLNNDFKDNKSDKIVKIIIEAAVYELIFQHNTPTKVIISEYVKTANLFLNNSQVHYVNAILDKISKNLRINDN